MTEKWKTILQNKEYKISNLGNVKKGNQKLKIRKNKDGYCYVDIFVNNEKKTVLVHRLVAQAFIPNPNKLPQVNHIDENKSNNFVNNLEWCSRSYNINYGNRNKKVAKKCSKPVNQYSLDGKLIKHWESIISVKRELGYNDRQISWVCKGNKYTYKGFVWKYATKE